MSEPLMTISPPPSELPFRVNAVRALKIAGFQPKNETEYGDMRDGRWLLEFDLLQENPL